MASSSQNSNTYQNDRPNICKNVVPLKIVVLGESQSGKSAFITKISSGIYQETYYPTTSLKSTLVNFSPTLSISKLLLDEFINLNTYNNFLKNSKIFQNVKQNIVLSKILQDRLSVNNQFDTNYLHIKLREYIGSNDNNSLVISGPEFISLLKNINKSLKNLKTQMDLYDYHFTSNDAVPLSDHDYEMQESIKGYFKPISITNSSSSIKSTKFFSSNYSKIDASTNLKLSQKSMLPNFTPILVDLIDTTSFNLDLTIPFLELSIGTKLDNEFLHNLANSPRLPVSAKPLLIGSGAGELNGSINGYVLMYSAIPSINPPSYENSESASSETNMKGHSSSIKCNQVDNTGSDKDPLNIIKSMKAIIYESWKGYKLYQAQHKIKSETDDFSLFASVKHLWKKQILDDQNKKNLKKNLKRLKSNTTTESKNINKLNINISKNPEMNSDNNYLNVPLQNLEHMFEISDLDVPPIIIVCSNVLDHRSSPLLIERGKALARQWNCGFMGIDSETGLCVEECLSMLIRDIVERKKLNEK